MPTFDVVSEVDQQEVRNAVDQARREIANRYDFKDTNSSIDLGDTSIELHTASEERLRALTQVLEEKLVRRKVSLKALAYGKVEDAAKGTVRQTATLNVGISDVKAARSASSSRASASKASLTSAGPATARERQEEGRPPNRDSEAARDRLRHPPPVHQLPRLARRARSGRQRSGGGTRDRGHRRTGLMRRAGTAIRPSPCSPRSARSGSDPGLGLAGRTARNASPAAPATAPCDGRRAERPLWGGQSRPSGCGWDSQIRWRGCGRSCGGGRCALPSAGASRRGWRS